MYIYTLFIQKKSSLIKESSSIYLSFSMIKPSKCPIIWTFKPRFRSSKPNYIFKPWLDSSIRADVYVGYASLSLCKSFIKPFKAFKSIKPL